MTKATARAPVAEKVGLTLEEAASYIGLSPDTLRPFVDRGEIPSSWFGRKRLIYRPALDAWFARRCGVEPVPAHPLVSNGKARHP